MIFEIAFSASIIVETIIQANPSANYIKNVERPITLDRHLLYNANIIEFHKM
jgi:hypothetical protein